jgi:deoxyribonuclease V
MTSLPIDGAERSFFEKLQTLLKRDELRTSNTKQNYGRICGVDAAYDEDNSVHAVASVYDSKELELLERSEYMGTPTFPYVSGLFFLREGPFVCEAISKLRNKPDLVCFDAQGLAHPRKMGLATICGMILGMPSIGISKTRLVGEMEDYKDGLKRLVIGNEQVGYVTSNPKRYWSPGFSIKLDGLENIIVNQRDICLRSINESHQRAVQLSQDRRR